MPAFQALVTLSLNSNQLQKSYILMSKLFTVK